MSVEAVASVDAVAPADALVFSSRDPGVLHGTLWMDVRTFDTAEGAARGLAALADLDAFKASLAALLVTSMSDNVAEEPLEGRDGQPTRLGGDLAHAATVSEVAAVQGTSEATAARCVNFSTALVSTHPAVHEALASGDITEAHARIIVEQAATLPEEAAHAFGVEALTRLRSRRGLLRTPSELRTVLRNLRERLHPDSIVKRKARARTDRGVWIRPEEDGMCTLTALLPAETGLAVYNRVDALARAAQDNADEHRTLPQLRADALAQLTLTATGTTTAPEAQPEGIPEPIADLDELLARIRAEIVVHIPVSTLLGPGDGVADLQGHGVIDATTARQLAAAAPTWERLLVDDGGTPLTLGRTAYKPPARLRRFIQYRDGTCVIPGCTCAAERAEVDHTIEWQDGGPTNADNLALLCRKHHALKSLALFHLRREAKSSTVRGELVWQTMLGRRLPAEPLDRSHLFDPRTDAVPQVQPPPEAPPPPAPDGDPAPPSSSTPTPSPTPANTGEPTPSYEIRNDPAPF